MANTVSPANSDEAFRQQIKALHLPAKPLVMTRTLDEKRRQCHNPRHAGLPCFCYEHLTFLESSDWPGAYRPDSPEPEVVVKKPSVINGATAKKKLTLGQYSAGKTGGGGNKSAGASPAPEKAERTPTSTPSSKPSTLKHGPEKLQPPPRSTPAQQSTPPVSSQNHARSPARPPKSAIGSKRPPEARPLASEHSSASSNNMRRTVSTDSIRPVKRHRSPSPPRSRISVQRPTPPPKSPELRLPPLLSPTLPKSIEDALAAEEKAKSEKTNSRDTQSSSGRPRSVSNVSTKSLAKPVPSGKKPPGSSSGTPMGASPRPGSATSPIKLAQKSKTTTGQKSGKRLASPPPLSPRPSQKTSVMVKFQFKRRIKEFRTLVKLEMNTSQKRHLKDDEPARSVKRQKVPGSLNVAKSASAKSPALQSPVLKHTKESKDKQLQTPPPKKSNGLTVKRSTEFALTPSNPHVTPSAGSTDRDRDRHSNSTGGQRISDAYQFKQEYDRLIQIGRAAKHEAQKDFDHPTQSIRLKAIFNIVDSCLMFLLSFIIWDRYQHLDRHTTRPEHWRTLLELSKVAAEQCRLNNQLVLGGLCQQVEAVARQHIFNLELDRFLKAPLPNPASTPSKAPTPDANATNTPDPRQQFNTYRTRIHQDNREMRLCWAEGLKNLPYDTLQEQYPGTWKGRSKEPVEAGEMREWPREVGKYRFPYALPLHVNSTPAEAVNFGARMLNEWAVRNGTKQKSRLGEMM